ncbi:meiotically up-regulated 71 protein [Ophiostoma piceae UAMH 11346]|uniref:Diphthine--ammonia ligase n=1 Tax=Ophiostoma piceae (strain UAMH 11346) TaxID=1262450 RepID=S3BZH7_OPHP1|nr:meiotically up-regulated 71 protein [Ophiostoma piceae UAMH 11346]
MSLNVIGLVSGGKDSFFSLLHCIAHGHRIVALANLHPEEAHDPNGEKDENAENEDLNSFMYQTVGHQVIPLYAQATGLPLYRQPIIGHAVQSGRDYSAGTTTGDETESMTALLQTVLASHPEANAVCAGALLSTYQRTRVESVAVRLGLASLAYMWKYPVLPSATSPQTQTDYLSDLQSSAFDARIIKVASGGLDESLLWTNVASPAGRHRLSRALERLGLLDADSYGSLLGEGGEYETLVVDGPRTLFPHGSIQVDDADRHVVHEGGGTSWLRIANAKVVPKEKQVGEEDKKDTVTVPQPGLFDTRFVDVLSSVECDLDVSSSALSLDTLSLSEDSPKLSSSSSSSPSSSQPITTWCVLPQDSTSITAATQTIVDQARLRLAEISSTSPTASIVRTLVVLRRMADFAAFNAVYGSLFAGGPPNPPARVTIACHLPQGVDVAVYFGVVSPSSSGNNNDNGRDGLHVQSRSYWAPANIGPYSQAVSILAAGHSGPRVVFIAGQIPLVPATMELPVAAFPYQATLALQHLWRIGIDVGVQWWSSAVAYVPRTTDSEALLLSQKTAVVAQAWRRAHEWRPKSEEDTEDDDDNDDGPDLWDRKFDSRYAMYGGGEKDANPQLPDWHVFSNITDKEKALQGGPVFLAEVSELPRGAPVEWHAHAGYSQLKNQGSQGSSVLTRSWIDPATKVKTYQTVLAHVSGSDADDSDDEDTETDAKKKEVMRLVQTVEAWPYAGAPAKLPELADVVYVDTQSISLSVGMAAPAVPCFSLWAGNGERLSAVVVRTSYE